MKERRENIKRTFKLLKDGDGSHESSAGPRVLAEDVSRRSAAAALLGTLGLVSLASCVDREGESTAETTQDISGTANFRYADTYTDLRSAPGTTTAPVAIVSGYGTINDGGGGLFYWSTSTTLIDNNGTIIVPSAGGGAWVRVYSGAINVRWFGAGLGATDDSSAIQAAINASLRNGVPWSAGAPTATTGGTVYLPAGKYFMTQALNISSTDLAVESVNVRLVGDGRYNTHIYLSGTTGTFVFVGVPGGSGRPIGYCEISHLHFANGNPNNAGYIAGNAISIHQQRRYLQ